MSCFQFKSIYILYLKLINFGLNRIKNFYFLIIEKNEILDLALKIKFRFF